MNLIDGLTNAFYFYASSWIRPHPSQTHNGYAFSNFGSFGCFSSCLPGSHPPPPIHQNPSRRRGCRCSPCTKANVKVSWAHVSSPFIREGGNSLGRFVHKCHASYGWTLRSRKEHHVQWKANLLGGAFQEEDEKCSSISYPSSFFSMIWLITLPAPFPTPSLPRIKVSSFPPQAQEPRWFSR